MKIFNWIRGFFKQTKKEIKQPTNLVKETASPVEEDPLTLRIRSLFSRYECMILDLHRLSDTYFEITGPEYTEAEYREVMDLFKEGEKRNLPIVDKLVNSKYRTTTGLINHEILTPIEKEFNEMLNSHLLHIFELEREQDRLRKQSKA